MPKIEHCLLGDTGLICRDDRIEDPDKRTYVIAYDDAKNYWATNPDDLFTLFEFCEQRKRK